MNDIFFHNVLKNNFEIFRKYIFHHDAKNLLCCRSSLYLKENTFRFPKEKIDASSEENGLITLLRRGFQDLTPEEKTFTRAHSYFMNVREKQYAESVKSAKTAKQHKKKKIRKKQCKRKKRK